MAELKSISSPEQSYLPPSNEQDEISLLDLFVVLYKQKNVILIATLLCGLLGAAYSLSKKEVYTYTTTLEIGTKGGGEGLVDDQKSVLAKLENSYIPYVMQQEISEKGEQAIVGGIEVVTPEAGNIIVLEIIGSQEYAEEYKNLLDKVSTGLINEHRKLLNIYRSGLEAQIVAKKLEFDALLDPTVIEIKKNNLVAALDKQKNRYEHLLNEVNNLERRKKELGSMQKFFMDELKTMSSQLATAQSDIKLMEKSAKTGKTDALVLLLSKNSINEDRKTYWSLKERVLVNINNQLQDIDTAIVKNQKEQELQKINIQNAENNLKSFEIEQAREKILFEQELNKVESKLKNVNETRQVVPPTRAVEKVKSNASKIIVASVVVGLMAGIFLAFFLHFMQQVRARVEQEENTV